MHPEVQRQLLGILRDVRPDIVLATHSVEILSEADPSEILLVDKSLQSARRLRDIEGVQRALDVIGSIQNITLTELARNRRIVFVEGWRDYKIIRRFAKVLNLAELAAGSGLTPLESGGFESWPKVQALAWGFRNTLGAELRIGAIYDRDYRWDEESAELAGKMEKEVEFAHFHRRKEIENYLLHPDVLQRAAEKASLERARRTGQETGADCSIDGILESVTTQLRSECSGQYISRYCAYFRSSGRDQATLTTEALDIFDKRWCRMESRVEIVPGKEVLKAVRDRLRESHGITLTNWRIIDCYRQEEVPDDLVELLRRLDAFRGNRTGK